MSTEDSASGLDRRSALKVAAAAAGATVLGAAGTGAAGATEQATEQAVARASEESHRFDAIVVGAGFAGITAARELRARGLRPLIVEAKSRIGGRTWTESFAGKRIELGAGWFSQHQALVARELSRYGVNLVPGGIAPERAVFPDGDGGFADFDPAFAFARNDELLTQLFADTEQFLPRPLEPLAAADKVRALDHLSLRDRISQLSLGTRDELWLSGTTATYSGGDSRNGGYTALAQWWALPGHDATGWNTLIGQSGETGMSGLLHAMLADARPGLVLNSPVRSVTDDGREITVVTRAGRHYTAPVAVIAVPANVWKDIAFAPGLPPVHAEVAQQGSGVPNSAKFWLRVRGDVGLVSAHAGEGAQISSLFSYYQLDGGEQLMIGFSQDPGFDVRDAAQVSAAVKRLVPGARVVEYKYADWGRDEFSRGGWALRRPGQLTRHLPAVQRPHGRLSFANDGIASGWLGFVDGAIETGMRAAEQATRLA
ncbi:flavin monoamine oxidase family protein [Streptomyces apocyni]|uniref:flavin monoamine oxidase family protein n=1 Tax=Streptomyces apocyni TaxID=2654677 RepID=UPI0012EA6519|nr:NAD(P)/FAD-dependent oxidoreductase [Streptomyces apocyni]